MAALRLDEILDDASPPFAALADGASVMWRLHLEGWSGPLPWAALENTPSPPGSSFGTLHRALVFAGLGRADQIRSTAENPNVPVAEACTALADFVDGDTRAATDRLLAREKDLVTIGGSRAQLEVLDDTLISALARSGRADSAAQRLDDRLARRPSFRDRRRLAMITP